MIRVLITALAIGLLAAACTAMLAGCTTPDRPAPERKIETVTVTLPGALRPCVPADLREPPAYPDTDDALKAAPAAPDRYALVTAGRALRIARAGEVEPIAKGCR